MSSSSALYLSVPTPLGSGWQLVPEPHFEMRQNCVPTQTSFPIGGVGRVPGCQVHRNEYLLSEYPGIEAEEGDTQDCFRDGASLVKQRMDYKTSHSKNNWEATVVLWKGWVLIQGSDPGEGANRVQIWELFPRQKQWDFGSLWRLESKAGEEIRVAFMQ